MVTMVTTYVQFKKKVHYIRSNIVKKLFSIVLYIDYNYV